MKACRFIVIAFFYRNSARAPPLFNELILNNRKMLPRLFCINVLLPCDFVCGAVLSPHGIAHGYDFIETWDRCHSFSQLNKACRKCSFTSLMAIKIKNNDCILKNKFSSNKMKIELWEMSEHVWQHLRYCTYNGDGTVWFVSS